MSSDKIINHLGQPVGKEVPHWAPPLFPPHEVIEGRLCRLEPLNQQAHAAGLFAANSLDREGGMWTYLGYGPFPTLESYRAWITSVAGARDPQFFAILDKKTGDSIGVASYLRIDPANGSIEVGHIAYSPKAQRTALATEAMYLLMRRAFDLGYRRYEWKCNALNVPSRIAAQRLGFSFEGIFRQATVVKGRNRDTAWYAIIDEEWPALHEVYLTWLSPENFDDHQRQRFNLSALTRPLLYRIG